MAEATDKVKLEAFAREIPVISKNITKAVYFLFLQRCQEICSAYEGIFPVECGQLRMVEELWEKKNIEFDAQLEERVMIMADESMLEIVFNNLIANAIKFTEPGGRVLLRQEKEGSDVVVTISDTGCGMDEETKRHIFDKFYQGDTSHSREGNGLGLALVKRVLDISGGRISVTSAPGEGTEFVVRLKRMPDRP